MVPSDPFPLLVLLVVIPNTSPSTYPSPAIVLATFIVAAVIVPAALTVIWHLPLLPLPVIGNRSTR